VDCIHATLEDYPEVEMRIDGQRLDDIALVLSLWGVLARESGIVLAGVGLESARRRDRPAESILLLRMTRVGVVSVAIGGVVLGVFGQWLVGLGRLGNGSGWVGASIGLLALTPAIGGVGGQRPKRTRRLATERIANRAPAAIDLRELLNDRWSRRANYAAVVLVVPILALMVFKP
jgi:hypothetical protein